MRRFLHIVFGIGILIVVFLSAFSFVRPDEVHLPLYNEVHEHADIVVWLNGEQLDLSQPHFQSTDELLRHRFLHLHDNDGTVLHVHAREQRFVDFFESIGMTLTDTCITSYEGVSYCSDARHDLSLYVRDSGDERWRRVDSIERFVSQDLQQVVLYFGVSGDTEDLSRALSSVTSDACYHSGTCPERGSPGSSWYETCGADTPGGCAALKVEPLRRGTHGGGHGH